MTAMGTLYLVRHGQASFGADDYDNLSPLGHQQSQRLGAYFRERGLQFEAVLMGSLKRHRQTFEGIQEGLQAPQLQPLVWPGLNEYDSHALIAAIHPQPLGPADTPERYRAHFRILCDALAQWMAGVISPQGMPSWDEFAGVVRAALDARAAREHKSRSEVIREAIAAYAA